MQVGRLGNATSAVTYRTGAGQWDASYDIWFDRVQFGFEPWQGGPGLGVDGFSFDLVSPAASPLPGTPAPAPAGC